MDNQPLCTFYAAVKVTIIGALYGVLLVFILFSALGVFDLPPEGGVDISYISTLE